MSVEPSACLIDSIHWAHWLVTTTCCMSCWQHSLNLFSCHYHLLHVMLTAFTELVRLSLPPAACQVDSIHWTCSAVTTTCCISCWQHSLNLFSCHYQLLHVRLTAFTELVTVSLPQAACQVNRIRRTCSTVTTIFCMSDWQHWLNLFSCGYQLLHIMLTVFTELM